MSIKEAAARSKYMSELRTEAERSAFQQHKQHDLACNQELTKQDTLWLSEIIYFLIHPATVMFCWTGLLIAQSRRLTAVVLSLWVGAPMGFSTGLFLWGVWGLTVK